MGSCVKFFLWYIQDSLITTKPSSSSHVELLFGDQRPRGLDDDTVVKRAVPRNTNSHLRHLAACRAPAAVVLKRGSPVGGGPEN